VVGVPCAHKIILVATDAIIPIAPELQRWLRGMAINTAQVPVCADQRKAILLMQLRDTVNDPALGGVTARAIIPDRQAVDIGMAGIALARCLVEHQRGVARLAVHLRVGACERIARKVVIERDAIRYARPIRRYMALGAIHLHGFAVRRLRVQPHSYQQEDGYL